MFSKTTALLLVLTVLALPARADRMVKQLQFGKQTIEVAADEVVTFQDMNGYAGISSSSSNNSQSLTVFKPAEGMAIQITFANLDVRNDGTSWPAYVNVYAGDPDPDGTFSYASSTSGVTASSTLPTGTVLEKLDGTYTNLTYTATDASGILSVGYLYRYAKAIQGWNATVRCITLENMAVTGASSDYSQVVANTTATEGITFGTAHVTTTGVMNADALTGITFSVPTNESAIDPLSLRLYSGVQPAFKGATALNATVAATDDGYAFTLNQPLSEGDNAFSIAGEFLGEAAPGVHAQVQITGVTTAALPSGVTPFTPGTPVTVTKPAIALISTTPQVVTVGDVPYYFYDDGGKDANITQGFEGQITFVPATEGMAIKADFSKLDLFNTSTVGYNDVFKFYNGREVNEANLITTLLDEPEIVKSTADDGSMTVYLKSTAGYPKSGWEAVVSQFLPGDMTLAGVTAQAATDATVAAGDTDAQMLVVDVLTDNTANPLRLTGLTLSTADASNIARARAYYLGKKNTFATTNTLGETTVDDTTITIAGDQELIEGHNYVAVVLDLNENAQTGDEIALTLTAATMGETTQAPTEAVTATRQVQNICRATQGSHSHNISGAWTFTNTEGYSGKYETADADYIVTFTPTVENTVAEIDFSSFDVYYASSSYGTKAVFEIYSGTEVNSANLLWNLKDASEANVGPGKKLRSQSADGSLTIRFNPKTTSSYYAGTGWTATVQPFQNHDMTVKSVTVNQTSSDVLAVGATDAALIDFDVETEGTLSVTTIKAVNLDLKDTHTAVSKVSVYYNNVNDRTTAVPFGSVENLEASAVTVTGERDLTEGSNYFWMTVDVKADAPAETAIDAKLMSLTDANDTVTTIENGDPAGERVVKYLYVMESGSKVVTVTEPMLFYDDGGKDGNITKGFKGTVTFVPGRDNSAVQINTLNTFSIGSGKMMIYSGREANADNILGKVTGYSTTTGPANLVSKAEDGSLTVVFEANTTATTLAGWEMEVSLHEKTPFTIETVEVANITDPVMRNSTGSTMQQLHLTVSGDKEPLQVSSVKFNTTGTTTLSDVAAARVYYTEHNALFSHDRLMGTLTTLADGENVVTLSEPVTIADNGDYYLWLAYDIAPEATVGNTVAAQTLELSVSQSDIAVTGEAAQRTVKAGLKGNYIIGSSDQAHYATFAAATAALQDGVEGAVTFQVEDGTYAENVWFAAVPGAGEQNTITFTSQSGNRDAVVVTGSGNSEYLPGSSSYKKGMVYVENTPYVTIEKMSFIPARESEYSYVVQTYDRSHHFTLRGCHVQATPVTSGYSGINLVKTTAVNEDCRNNDYGTFENNLLDGGYIALYLGGTNNVGLTRERGLVVRGNVINEAGSKGVYVYDEDDALIENNTIYQSLVQKTGYWGLDLARMRGASVVRGNKVTSATTYYSGGIELRGETYGTAQQPILVYNNVVNITASPSNSSAGIEIDGDQKFIELYNNTVRIDGNGGYCYYTARRSGASYNGIKLQNNLLQNLTGSPAMFIHADYSGMAQFVNNAFWGETVLDGTTVEALNELEGNSGNIAEQAQFLSEADLHLMEVGNLNMGLPVGFITTDADGNVRSSEAPTVGAYEFAEVVEEKPEMVEGYPTVSNVTETGATITSKWTVSGKLYMLTEAVTEPEQGAPARPRKAPGTDDLMAATPQDINADTEVSTTIGDLQPGTSYKVYMMVVSALGVESDIVETDAFTTLRHIEPLMVEVDDVQTVEAGTTATIEAIVAGGDEPYTFEWRDQMNRVVGNELNLIVTPDYSYGYRLTVTSADGQTATAKTAVRVLGEAVTASMDDNYLEQESHWAYDPTTESMVTDGFYSGSYYFNTGAWPSYNYWYGYSLSNETATSYTGLDDQWHSAVGQGHNGSANYVMAFPEGQFVEVTNSEDGDNLLGVYVSNSAYAYNGMAVGDGFATQFSQGSWFAVNATGFNCSTQTGTVTFYLSDYRSENAADHYILDTWQWMDLRPLGKVTKVCFTLDGSDKSSYGLNTAAYFVMDDFNCERDLTQASAEVATGTTVIDLASYFDLALDGSTVTYGMEIPSTDHQGHAAPAANDMTVTLNDNGTLTVVSDNEGSKDVIVWATQRGQSQYIMLNVTASTSTAINDVNAHNGVTSVTYVNAAGMKSDKPFNGINIVVTRYADGTVTTAKVVK
ncbi:MAG: DUF4465 domain-containing protein [Muribaculaceae bacterium]|nr:DUF4465 domain-containing protein [Muribaculaceae bacterium]